PRDRLHLPSQGSPLSRRPGRGCRRRADHSPTPRGGERSLGRRCARLRDRDGGRPHLPDDPEAVLVVPETYFGLRSSSRVSRVPGSSSSSSVRPSSRYRRVASRALKNAVSLLIDGQIILVEMSWPKRSVPLPASKLPPIRLQPPEPTTRFETGSISIHGSF